MSRKQVLVFTETALAVSETFIADHCRALDRYEPILVALYGSGEHHADVPRHLLHANQPDRFTRLAFRLGVSSRMDAAIARIKPDIIHAHYLTNGAFLQPYATRHAVPLVVTAHGHDATRRLKPTSLYDLAYRLKRPSLLKHAALILPVSNFLRQILLDDGFSADRTRTHYLGIPLSSQPPIDVENTPPNIVFVGRLTEKKGIDTVLDAFAIVRASHAAAQLHIVGDGPLRAMAETKASVIGNVTLYGAQPPERTRQIMRNARLLTLPSRQASDGDVEGFGLVLIEAQSLGVPVVTSNTSGTVEAILPDKTGFAVDPADPKTLAAAFLKLIESPQLAKTMGAQAHRFVSAHFDIVERTRTLEQFYDQVLATRTAK